MLTKMELPIYLDAAATTPVHPEVLEAMLPYFTQHFGNANSQHIYGQIAKKAIDDARQSIADHINVLPEEIIFTSGATEAINLAIRGYWEANRDKGNHIITVKTEHKAVLNTCAYLETLGVDVTYLDVDHFGRITEDQLRAAFRTDTLLACVMHVNNETGLIQDIHSFAETCAEQGVAFFTDSTQAIGHIETDYGNSAISMACMSAHKIAGPKGVGAFVKKKEISVSPILIGGSASLEAGTQSTSQIVGLNQALTMMQNRRDKAKSSPLGPNFGLRQIVRMINDFYAIESKRTIPLHLSAPHILHLSDVSDLNLLKGKIALSDGSACQQEFLNESHVAKCLNLENDTYCRLSFPPYDTQQRNGIMPNSHDESKRL